MSGASTVRLALHTFGYEWRFRHGPGFDVHAFLARATDLGMAGVHISLNGFGFRCAGGTDPERLRAIGADAADRGLFVECDTSGTDPDHLAALARAARQIGADRLRTYTRRKGEPAEVVEATARDLKAAAPRVADEGVLLLLENHEDLTGAEVARVLDEVGHPAVAALYDFGNPMNVGEEPMDAARAMAPHVRSAHLKDHIVTRGGDGSPIIVGVPNGAGRIDIPAILGFLIDEAGLERICIECSHGYVSPIARRVGPLDDAPGATFEIVEPPHDPAVALIDDEGLRRADPAALFALEQAAVARSAAHTRLVLRGLGFSPVHNSRGGVYRRGPDEVAFADRHL